MGKIAVRCIYLHGFASGPLSSKAQFFSRKLSERCIDVQIPDLNGEAFQKLTISGQLQIVRDAIARKPAADRLILIGSSMGGLLSVLSANEHPHVDAMILLAPGFGLHRRWHELLGINGLSKWRETGSVEVFHYGADRMLPLNYDFIVDAERYITDGLSVKVPTLVFHGENDATVPVIESRRFKQDNKQLVDLRILPSDHDLLDVLDYMWDESEKFLSGHRLIPNG